MSTTSRAVPAGRPRRWTVARVAIGAWALLWILLALLGWDGEPPLSWVMVIAPQVLLGLIIGRWWAMLLPFALPALALIVGDAQCLDPEGCIEDISVPVEIGILLFISMPGALCTAVGIALRGVWEQRMSRTARGLGR